MSQTTTPASWMLMRALQIPSWERGEIHFGFCAAAAELLNIREILFVFVNIAE